MKNIPLTKLDFMIVNYNSPGSASHAHSGHDVGDVNGPPPWRIPEAMQKWLMCLLVLLSCATGSQMFAQSQLARYARTISTGNTYTPITGTTFVSGTYDENASGAVTMGGSFAFG